MRVLGCCAGGNIDGTAITVMAKWEDDRGHLVCRVGLQDSRHGLALPGDRMASSRQQIAPFTRACSDSGVISYHLMATFRYMVSVLRWPCQQE